MTADGGELAVPIAPAVTVLTLTRHRAAMLQRAIASVAQQDYRGQIEHLVIVDDDDETYRQLRHTRSLRPGHSVRAVLVPREAGQGFSPDDRRRVYARISELLNLGVRESSFPWIAFLDDDNEYLPEHLRQLWEFAIERRLDAVHSARRVVRPDGSPYLEPVFPGARDRAEGERIYRIMCDRGVWVEGTNILQDRADRGHASQTNSTEMTRDDPVLLVDQNLWLMRKAVLAVDPFPSDWTDDDAHRNTCPDDRFLIGLIAQGVRFESNRAPSVRYYLGGVSNGDEKHDRR